LKDARIWSFLLLADEDLAEAVRQGKCVFCGEALHRADYPRKPRGGPDGLPLEYSQRISFCCCADDCRRRATPPSVRFLARKVYLKVLVVLVTAMRQGPTPPGAKLLHQFIGVSRRTLVRWQGWWRDIFPRTRFWRGVRSRFLPPLTGGFPRALLETTEAETSLDRFLALLRFLSPITSRPGLEIHAS
jgi:hypothetical protein